MKQTIVIGKITGAHGIQGEIKVYPLTDDAQRFYDLAYILCENERYTVTGVRFHGGQALLTLEGITERSAAEAMRGKMVELSRKDAVPLKEGEYFIEDLKGMKVYDTSSGRQGNLKDVLQTGSVDILEFEIDGKTVLMPYLNAYVSEVNLSEGYIRADLSRGVSS